MRAQFVEFGIIAAVANDPAFVSPEITLGKHLDPNISIYAEIPSITAAIWLSRRCPQSDCRGGAPKYLSKLGLTALI
jgi:hypothetical protein